MENNRLTDEQIVEAIETERVRLNKIIAAQNDSFRQTWGANFTVPGRILFTPGVCDKGGLFMQSAMLAIMVFDDFTEDNDRVAWIKLDAAWPEAEHGFYRRDRTRRR